MFSYATKCTLLLEVSIVEVMPRPIQEAFRDAGKTADWFESEGPSPDNEIPVSDYFLGLLADVQHLGNEKVRDVVELALGAGATWCQIGEVLGISSEQAERRFGAFGEQAMLSRHSAKMT